MKHKLTLLGSLLLVAGSVAMSVNVHRVAVQQQLAQDAKVAAQHLKAVAIEQTQARANAQKAASAVQELKAMQSECLHGVAAYNLLTPYQKSKAIMPNCSLPLQ